MYKLPNTQLMFPPNIDSQVLTSWLTCPRKWANRYIYHFAQPSWMESTDLVAGGAIAAAMETARTEYYLHGKDEVDAVGAALIAAVVAYGDHEPYKPEKSLTRVLDAVIGYFDTFPLGNDDLEPIILADGKPAIEAKFSIPIGIIHPDTGEELCYTGTMDLVATRWGMAYPVDEKTTGGNFTQSWIDQWALRNQFMGYCWALGKAEIPSHGVIVRGLTFPKKVDPGVVASHQYTELTVPIQPSTIGYWEAQLRQEVGAMIEAYHNLRDNEPTVRLSFGVNCNDYSRKCEYFAACTEPNPEFLLSAKFEQRVWISELRENVPLAQVLQTQHNLWD